MAKEWWDYSEEELKIKDMFVRKDGHSGITKHMYWATKMWEARNENNL